MTGRKRWLTVTAKSVMLLAVALCMAACDNATPPVAGITPQVISSPSSTGFAPTAEPSATQPPSAVAVITAESSQTVVAAATIVPTDVPATRTPGTPAPLTLAERQAEFQQVWSIVKQHYLYTDFRGLDWGKVKEQYAPRVASATTDSAFYAAITEMVGLLKDQHSRFISPVAAQDEDHLDRGDASYAGIGILSKYEGNSSMVTLVFPSSPAQDAGIKRRDRVLAIDGNAVRDGNLSSIVGPAGTQVRLTIQSPGEKQRDLTLTRRTVTGKITASSSRLQANSSIGYLLIPSLWADDMSEQVEEHLNELLAGPPLKGLVIDLRSNEGGWRSVLTGILGQFVRGNVGNFYSQEKNTPLVPDPGKFYPQFKDVPLVVLVDGDSQSYAEVLSAALQSSGRAKVVGTTTAGNTETIYAYNMADGSRLWVAQEGYKLPNGTNLEGRGVIPDVKMDLDWTRYSLERDPQILKAVELLTK